MPKRAEAYLEQQRETIAAAVLELMKEEGPHAINLRGICKRASISMGAFYVHFESKQAAIDAAFLLHQSRYSIPKTPDTWQEFESVFELKNRLRQTGYKQLVALGLELSAMQIRGGGLETSFVSGRKLQTQWIKAALTNLQNRGEIEPIASIDSITNQIEILGAGAEMLSALVSKNGSNGVETDFLQAVRLLVRPVAV